ncbi:HNH endonuclease [Vibrio parahaemolyticus]|uniref:HNH endonuclease n=1 Tax=Vibrio parahaemolyticus TaxID=670 RepID=UPI00192A2271|nr:HNH endonuclease [Vibrio parahaemolyticus]MCF9126252.1 HNH endonuclease [Vibrio parahaemolyticus]
MADLNIVYGRLVNAVEKKRSSAYCLRLWSKFIRERDGHRCVICNSKRKLSAHHIIRKSFWKHLKFQTGNGITLCHVCHKDPHSGFNGRPDLSQPMDAQGGEKIDLFTGYLGALVIDSYRRNLTEDHLYYFSDGALEAFKKIQGIPEAATFEGRKIEKAYQIWNQTPRGMFEAILNSLGVTVAEDYVQDEEVTMYYSDTLKKEDGSPTDIMYFRYIPPTEFKENPDDGVK